MTLSDEVSLPLAYTSQMLVTTLPVKHNSCNTGLCKNDVSSPKLLSGLKTPPLSR